MTLKGVLALLLVPAIAGCAAPSAPVGAQLGDPFGGYTLEGGSFQLDGAWSGVLSLGRHRPLPDEAIDLASAIDGENIRLGYVRPDVAAGTAVPIILLASDFDADVGRGPLRDLRGRSLAAAFLVDNFLPHGYAIAFVALRGSSGSGGCFSDMSRETAGDIDQAIRWLATREWANGRVGMIGFSYAGGTQWLAAGFANPHLRTIVPMSGVLDRYHEWYKNGSGPSPDPVVAVPEPTPPEPSACPARLDPARRESFETGERADLWIERNDKPRIESSYTGSVLVAHGLGQDLPAHVVYPWLARLEARGGVVKHVLGQWDHAMPDDRGGFLVPEDRAVADRNPAARHNPTPRADWAELLLRWYDRWLKDAPVELGPRVEVQDTAHGWRGEDAWPPARATELRLHLAGGRLAPEPGPSARVTVGPDPTWRSATTLPAAASVGCATCATFESEPFPQGLRFAGLPHLRLTARPTADSGHLTAYLLERLPAGADGPIRMLTCAKMNLRFAAGGETATPIAAGRALAAAMEFQPVDAALAPGSSLLLVVSQGRYDGCAALSGDTLYGPQPSSAVEIEVGGEAHLSLLTFSVEETAFFEPPVLGPEPR